MRDARHAAAELAKSILALAVESFDEELNQVALGREAGLECLGAPIFEDVMRSAYPVRNWLLWEDVLCNVRHSKRELARNILQWLAPEKEPEPGLSCLECFSTGTNGP
jgi:hypothetical protein